MSGKIETESLEALDTQQVKSKGRKQRDYIKYSVSQQTFLLALRIQNQG